MRLLLDSNALIWWAAGERLSRRVRSWIDGLESEVHVSIASIWEIAIKRAKGKLTIAGDLHAAVRDSGFVVLPITWEHTEAVLTLPHHHSDPFDRMLVAQAQLEGLSIVSDDVALARYQVHVVPAS